MSTTEYAPPNATPATGDPPLDDLWWNARCIWALDDLMHTDAFAAREMTDGEAA